MILETVTAPARQGKWIQTYSRKKFWTVDPRAEDVELIDIAHALSMMCRYNGHCERFYSVGEHCVLIARYLLSNHAPIIRLWGLMHDASEAYIADITRPTKPYLANYQEIEARIMASVCEKFGLPKIEPPEVKQADNAILFDELQQNMKMPPEKWEIDMKPTGVKLQFWTPEEAKREFLFEYYSIMDQIEKAA